MAYCEYMKAGSSETDVSGGGTDHNTDPTYGLGLRYNFTRQFGLRGEWERFRASGSSFGKSDVDVYSVSGDLILVSIAELDPVLDEVAKLGSRVLVIAQGRLIASGDYRDLRELMDDRAHRIRIAASDPRRLATALVERGLVEARQQRRCAVSGKTVWTWAIRSWPSSTANESRSRSSAMWRWRCSASHTARGAGVDSMTLAWKR